MTAMTEDAVVETRDVGGDQFPVSGTQAVRRVQQRVSEQTQGLGDVGTEREQRSDAGDAFRDGDEGHAQTVLARDRGGNTAEILARVWSRRAFCPWAVVPRSWSVL